MVGYVVAFKPELKMWEYEMYSAYYCGVCKSIGRRFGIFPRLALSYDSAFLAVILGAFSERKETVERQHCIVHPFKKKNVCINSDAVDYAADIMIILAYHKLIDDINDDNSTKAHIMKPLFEPAYKKLEKNHKSFCETVAAELRTLSEMENQKCDSIDRTSDAFARIMEAAVEGYRAEELSEGDRLALKVFAFNLGKWMYLIDALDDIDENIRDGNYNPLIYRFGFDKEKEDAVSFRKRISEYTEFMLFQYLGEMSKAFELMSLKKNEGITANIIYMGLHKRTEEVLKKGNCKDERSL